jgi:hypothetical protein
VGSSLFQVFKLRGEVGKLGTNGHGHHRKPFKCNTVVRAESAS